MYALVRTSRPSPLVALALGIALGACSAETSLDGSRGATAAVDMAAPAAAPAPAAPERIALTAATAESKQALDGQGGFAPPDASAASTQAVTGMIIRNGFASIEVDSLEIAVAAVRQLATTLGGFVGNVSMTTGEFAVRSATIEIKVPSARFDEALTGLTPIGKVENSSSTAEDVGEEFVDITARVANARRLEERLVTLLATRTGKLEDVLAVERELARVRQEIERYEGRLRYLRTRVATSTLTVTVHEAAPLVSPNPGTSVLGEAVKQAWRNFVRLVAATIESLGVLVPAGLVAWLGYRVWRRRRTEPAGLPAA